MLTLNHLLVPGILLVFLLTGCEGKHGLVADCSSTPEAEALCLFTNPEDGERLPNGRTLLISQMGNMEGSKPGDLVFFDPHTRSVTPAFPVTALISPDTSLNWGGANCPGIPGAEFSPHGTSLKQRDDGRWQLAVVNHGGRESVEMFEVLNTNDAYTLEWRGCVIPGGETYMNDVALLKNGGFVASHMFERHSPVIFGMPLGVWKSQLRMNTGHVFEWQPSTPDSVRVLTGSDGPFINGVLVSADDRYVFANVYVGNEIRKMDRVANTLVGHVDAMQVDNTAWDENGRILAASHTGAKLDQLTCTKNPGATCGFGYTILRIEPETLATEILFTHEGGAPMGAATVALQLGNDVYLGSFSGDRMIRRAYPD